MRPGRGWIACLASAAVCAAVPSVCARYRPVTVPVGRGTAAQPDQIRIAATTGGRGWLVWSTNGRRIRASRIG